MEQLRLAFAFRRPDVTAFLDEITLEEFEEWVDFLSLEPQGWQALSMATTRLSFWMAQVRTKKRLKEKDFRLKVQIRGPVSGEVEAARLEAYAIRTSLMAGEAPE